MRKKNLGITQIAPVVAPQMLTIDQVAARLNVHRTTVYEFIHLSGLKVTRLAAHAVRVDEEDLKAWIEQRKAAS